MDTTYNSYRYAFESCRSYKDEAVNHNDFASICRRYHLNVSKAMEAIADRDGRVTLDNFVRYMKHYQQQQHYYDRGEEYRPSSPHPPPPIPPRPHSGSKLHRQAVHPSHNYQTRRGVKYPTSPVAGHHDQEDFVIQEDLYTRQTLRQELSRTPEHFLSPEDRPGHDRHRPPDQLDHYPTSEYLHTRHLRPSSPPPPLPSHHRRPTYNRDVATGRSDRARSYKAEESDDEDGDGLYPPPAPSRRPTCKGCKALQRQVQERQDDLKAMRVERERLEQNNERLRKDLQVAQSADLAYAQLYRDNERLHQELKRRKDGDPDSDRAYFDRQYEELKRTKDYLEEEIYRLKAYKKECSHLKAEYNAIKLKNEQLQRTNWQLVDDNQRLTVKMMEDDKSSLLSRRPGDGGSGEASARSSYASELGFQRHAQLRQTYHSAGVTRDPSSSSSRPQRGHGAEMKRTSSAGRVLESDEPVKESAKMDEYAYSYSRAKSHRSGTSDADATSVVDGIGFSMVSTTPDEQSQVFMVMGEDVSKSVLPEGLQKDKELAMIYALQNCNTVQELIKCLISYGVSTSADKLEGFRVESEQLKSTIEHLRSKNTTLANSFENTKSNMESMYNHVQVVEANNVRLRHALRLCQQACEVFEVLLELRVIESRHSSSNTNYFPSFPEVYNSLESSTRSPDREQVSMKHSVVYKVRSLLHTLDANTELQTYHPGVRTRHGSADYQQTSHWAGSSQNTGTSGLSSMSGGLDGEVTPSEVERLKMYTQALLYYKNHLVSTLVPVDGLTGLDTVKKGVQETDCATAEHTGQIIDLEDAANAEELCKIREEKAELRSQIYMMEQEKRRMELEVSRMLLHKQKCDKVVKELQFQLKEEKRRRKERKGRRGDAANPPHDAVHMSELSIEYQSALEREKELAKRYEDLFNFLQMHVKDSQCTSEDLMRFVKDLRRANSALVDAFEKSKKRQQAEKKRMKQELVSYMNRVQNSSAPASDDPPTATIYA